MPQFRYHAQTADGDVRSGRREAVDADELRALLAAEGLTLIRCEQVEATSNEAAFPSVHETTGGGREQVPVLAGREVEELSLHLSDLVQARLPLSEGLAALAAEIPSNRLRRTMLTASRRLRSGDDLSNMLTELKLPPGFTRLVTVGLESGRLADILTQYAAQRRKAAELRSWLFGALIYPAAICGLAFVILLGVLYWLGPLFADIYVGFYVEIPAITRGFIWLSELLREKGGWLLLGAVILIAGVTVLWRAALTPRARASIRAALPLVGNSFRMLGMTRFVELLAILIEHEQPLPEALRNAGEGCDDELMRQAAAALADQVEAGQPMGSVPLLPDFPAALLETCEQRQFRSVLPDVLRTLSEMYETRLRGDVLSLVFILEPALLIICGGVLIMVVASLFSPLILLLNALF